MVVSTLCFRSGIQLHLFVYACFFFFTQKTAYEVRISDWSSAVCSSDLAMESFFSSLGLERGEEALHGGIIPYIAGPAHRAGDPIIGHQPLELDRKRVV